MKLEEGCAQIADGFEATSGLKVGAERVVSNVMKALARVGSGVADETDWEVDLRVLPRRPVFDRTLRKMVIRRFTHEVCGWPIWPEIVNVTLTTNGRIRAVCVQRNCAPVDRKN
jgi:hypothetical protein